MFVNSISLIKLFPTIIFILTSSPLSCLSSPASSSSLSSPLLTRSSSSSIQLDNIFTKCLSHANLSTVQLGSIDLSPMLSCHNDLVSVSLKKTHISGLNSYSLTPFHATQTKDHYRGTLKLPLIKVEALYHVNGTIAHMFPVNGRGLIEVDYAPVTLALEVTAKSGKADKISMIAVDFNVTGFDVRSSINGVDIKASHLDGMFQDSLTKIIFWRSLAMFNQQSRASEIINCLETAIKLIDVPVYPDDSSYANDAFIEPEVSTLSRVKRETADNLPRIPVEEISQNFWADQAKSTIKLSLDSKKNNKIAKNVILFIGDGMGISTLTAARIFKDQLANGPGGSNKLIFEDWPEAALIKTFNLDRQTPDSAGTATAFLCGVKANYGVLGVNGKIFRDETDCDTIKANSVDSILSWAQSAGKGTGIVTTTRITHATPGAAYAHVPNRDWESDTTMHSYGGTCRDIATQLIEDEPGSKLQVIMGGGWKNFVSSDTLYPFSSNDNTDHGNRTSDVDLIQRWVDRHASASHKYSYVDTSRGLKAINTEKTDYILGLFSQDHLPYELERSKTPEGAPSLTEMVESAVKVLRRNENGFVLLVESGLIDIAHHDNWARLSLAEVLSLESAIQKATELVSTDDTMMIVTADHSHGFVINGYPLRGNDIFGVSNEKEGTTGKSFTTLMYTTGPGHTNPRPDAQNSSRSDLRYRSYSAINLASAVHGGEDVALYSVGPNAHLFNGLKDQTYIAHVIGYSACIGEYAADERCKNIGNGSPGNITSVSFKLILSFALFAVFAIKSSFT